MPAVPYAPAVSRRLRAAGFPRAAGSKDTPRAAPWTRPGYVVRAKGDGTVGVSWRNGLHGRAFTAGHPLLEIATVLAGDGYEVRVAGADLTVVAAL